MADISKEIQQIEKAVYGEEVRGSIRDAILKINVVAETSDSKADDAVAQVGQAREEIAEALEQANTTLEEAKQAEQIATTKAEEASASASTATSAAETATTKAEEANTSASTATSAAQTATAKAGEASASASTATSAAQTATAKAGEASASASTATSAAETATTKAEEANTSASTATSAAQTATAKAGEASASASTATNAMETAKAKAEEADGSATRAEEAADRAESVVGIGVATLEKAGIVKASQDVTVAPDGTLGINTVFQSIAERANIESGDTWNTVLGKINKYFGDIKPHAFLDKITEDYIDNVITQKVNNAIQKAAIVNNAVTTIEGTVLDGRMGKTLQDQITEQNKNINGNDIMKHLPLNTTNLNPFNIDDTRGNWIAGFANENMEGTFPHTAWQNIVQFDTCHFISQLSFDTNPLSSKDLYLRNKWDNAEWQSWNKIITNSDINVQKNTQKILLTTTKANVEIGEPNNTYYIIRNDYCFVSLSAIKMTSIEGGNIFYNLPKPVGRVNFTLHAAGGDSKPIIWGRIDDTAIFFNNINSNLIGFYGWGSFCYPIAK